ncbi:MAG: hypothetical protein U0794_13990 [Isosphaeraceae bacterium]
MRRFVDSLGSWFLAVALAGSCAADEPPAPGDAELKAHLQAQQRKIDNPALDVSVRERLVMELAATLDRTAQAAASPEVRRERWTDAIALIDRFNEANPGHAMKSTFEVQAGVYFWARARSWVAPDRVMLADATARSRATDELNASVSRIRPVVSVWRGDHGGAERCSPRNGRSPTSAWSTRSTTRPARSTATRPSGSQHSHNRARGSWATPSCSAALLASAGRHEERRRTSKPLRRPIRPSASDLLDTRVAILRPLPVRRGARPSTRQASGAGSQLLKVRIGLAEWSKPPTARIGRRSRLNSSPTWPPPPGGSAEARVRR